MTKTRSFARLASGAIALAAILAVPIALGDSGTAWDPIDAAPSARQEVSYVALDGKLYLAAGNDRSQQRYDPATDQWTPVAGLPVAFEGLDHVHGVAVDGRIVYIGGLVQWEHPFPLSAAVAIYDPASNSFTAGSPMPSPRAAGGVAAWNGKVIYAGGLGPDGSVARVDAYDPETDEWSELTAMPRARDHFQAAVVGDRLYAIGGRQTTGSEGDIEIDDIAAVDALDLTSDSSGTPEGTWQAGVTSLPTLRGGLGTVAVGRCIYAIGGESEAAGPDGVTGATEFFDTKSGTWHALAPLSVPRHGIQAAVVGETIYIAAGGTVAFDYVPTDAHESLDVGDSEPCATDEQPAGDSGASSDDRAPTGNSRKPRITRLVVRPRRLDVESLLAERRKAEIVAVLSHAGKVGLRLNGHYAFRKRMKAGRNVTPLPLRSHGAPLPPGGYRLSARIHGPQGAGHKAVARFRVVG